MPDPFRESCTSLGGAQEGKQKHMVQSIWVELRQSERRVPKDPLIEGIWGYISSSRCFLLLSSTFLLSWPNKSGRASFVSVDSRHGILYFLCFFKIRMCTQCIWPNMSDSFMQLREEMFLCFVHSVFSSQVPVEVGPVTMGVTKSKNDVIQRTCHFPNTLVSLPATHRDVAFTFME